MRRQRKPAADRKSEIVLAAIRLAGSFGPDRVTTQMLADAVGVTQPAIFRHFSSKSDIWLAVGQMIARRLEAEDTGEPTDNPLGRLIEITSRHFGQIAQTPAIPAILFSQELHADNAALRLHFEAVINNRLLAFARLIKAAINAGQLAPQDPNDMAALLLATIQGLAMRWSLEGRAFDLQAEGARLTATLLCGTVAPKTGTTAARVKAVKPVSQDVGPIYIGAKQH